MQSVNPQTNLPLSTTAHIHEVLNFTYLPKNKDVQHALAYLHPQFNGRDGEKAPKPES